MNAKGEVNGGYVLFTARCGQPNVGSFLFPAAVPRELPTYYHQKWNFYYINLVGIPDVHTPPQSHALWQSGNFACGRCWDSSRLAIFFIM